MQIKIKSGGKFYRDFTVIVYKMIDFLRKL